MIHALRSFMNSKVGVIVTLAFLAVIAVAFAVSDVTGSGNFSGLSSGDRFAVVGDRKLSMNDLEASARNDFSTVRNSNPTATMEGFLAEGGLDTTVSRLLDRAAISEFARSIGLRAGGRLVDSEIVKIPAFSGPSGKFDENAYRSALAQQGLTDALVRDDIENALYARQVITPVLAPGTLPQPLVKRYAALLKERRHGEIGLLRSEAFAPTAGPTDAQLQTFYNANRTRYMRPERRVIRYAVFGADELKNVPAPTETEIAARYKANSALYAASEKRRMTQLVVPTEAAAKAIAAEVAGAGGKTFDVAAREKGLAVAAVGPLDRTQLTSQSSAAVAQAVFATAQGKLSTPARGPLGFYLIRVDAIDNVSGRTLEQARGEISAALAVEKRNAALADFAARIEEEFDGGSSLADIAKELGLTVETTPDLVATGAVYAKPTERAPAVLNPALQTAFEMEEGQPQLAEVEAAKTFLIFDVSKVTDASPAPIAEIREPLIAAWRRAEGDKRAKAAADRVMKAVAGGETVTAALAKEGPGQGPIDKVNMDREQLSKVGGGRTPPVLALMFSMAEGTVKRLEAPNDEGWFVVKLDDIEPGKLAANDPLILRASQQLAQAAGQEYAEQFTAAARKEVGVEQNKDAVAAVRKRLTGN